LKRKCSMECPATPPDELPTARKDLTCVHTGLVCCAAELQSLCNNYCTLHGAVLPAAPTGAASQFTAQMRLLCMATWASTSMATVTTWRTAWRSAMCCSAIWLRLYIPFKLLAAAVDSRCAVSVPCVHDMTDSEGNKKGHRRHQHL
jgi:hypothetical protein